MRHSFSKIKYFLGLAISALSLWYAKIVYADTAEPTGIQLQVPIFGYTQTTDFAAYLGQIYNVALYILVPFTIVVIIFSGVLWIMSGGDRGLIKKAKDRMIYAFIGLGIALGSYLILSVFNLTTLTVPAVEYIKPIELISQAAFTAITNEPLRSPQEYYALAEQIAKDKGLHPCFMKTMLDMESGGRPNAIGHDENTTNAKLCGGRVPARTAFAKSGKKFSGTTFPATDPCSKSLKNDDKVCADKEDLCLDWRWSHGFSASQFTISGTIASTGLGAWCKPNVPSRNYGGKCYTAKEAMNPKTSLELGAEMLKKYKPNNAYAAFKAYNGSDAYASSAKSKFDKCCQERGGC